MQPKWPLWTRLPELDRGDESACLLVIAGSGTKPAAPGVNGEVRIIRAAVESDVAVRRVVAIET